MYIIGKQSVSNVSLHEFEADFRLQPLVNKRMNIHMELPNKPIKATAASLIKAISGQDIIAVNKKFLEISQEELRAVCVFGSNYSITLEEYDQAFWNRARLIPMNYSVPEEKKDFKLLQKLIEERDGIVTRAVHAFKTLVKNQYRFPFSQVAEKMKTRWSGLDPYRIQEFLEEKCDLSNPDARTRSEVLYNCYKRFCDENGLSPTSEKQFSMVLKGTHGLKNNRWKEVHNRNSQYGFYGIQLKEDPAIDHDTVIIS